MPGALRLAPPLTEEESPLAVLLSPPLTEAKKLLAVLAPPADRGKLCANLVELADYQAPKAGEIGVAGVPGRKFTVCH